MAKKSKKRKYKKNKKNKKDKSTLNLTKHKEDPAALYQETVAAVRDIKLGHVDGLATDKQVTEVRRQHELLLEALVKHGANGRHLVQLMVLRVRSQIVSLKQLIQLLLSSELVESEDLDEPHILLVGRAD